MKQVAWQLMAVMNMNVLAKAKLGLSSFRQHTCL